LEIVRTDEGIQIDSRDEQKVNAPAPRSEIMQPDSNVTRKSSWQSQKLPLGIVLTDEGIQID
jgi:hypothetical protein